MGLGSRYLHIQVCMITDLFWSVWQATKMEPVLKKAQTKAKL